MERARPKRLCAQVQRAVVCPVAISVVAQKRAADLRQLYADLMGTAGVQLYVQQRAAIAARQGLIL